MKNALTRRSLLGVPLGAAALWSMADVSAAAETSPSWASFPAQDPARVRNTVLYAHFDFDKVKTLVEASPALANSAMDWGFGDWETALGAASHMGLPEMAEFLMNHGARPDLFTHAMLGHLDAVRQAVASMPGIQRTPGPHGISLLAHAKQGGEAAAPVVAYLEELGDADPQPAVEPLPLPATSYLGAYAWSDAALDRLDVNEKEGVLRVQRGEGFPRTLFHLGNHEFHPGGAPEVRIRFRVDGGRATALSIFDPDLIVEASWVKN